MVIDFCPKCGELHDKKEKCRRRRINKITKKAKIECSLEIKNEEQ